MMCLRVDNRLKVHPLALSPSVHRVNQSKTGVSIGYRALTSACSIINSARCFYFSQRNPWRYFKMIFTHSCNQPTIQLPNSALSGVNLIPGSDYKGYSMYEARIDAAQTVPLTSPEDKACVHYYYFITGSGKCEREGGKEGYDVGPDHVVALSSNITHTLKVSAEGAMRVLVVYYPDVTVAYKSLELVKSLSDLVGTERDISFGNGNSRRFTVKKDGFPLTITNTRVMASTSSKQEYKNQIEAAYYIAGTMTYHWQDGDGGWTGEQTKVDKKNGTNYFMNMHDKHEMVASDNDCFCICVFNPALTGNEIHNYGKDGFSSY
ncbi:uncharacterized protein LOC119728802 isoform X2 [Patiria miniata]|uniref:L-ectoine synthase n=2 Tax=Patiria miniata TaxID=46514 RepID=A0A914A0B4_PATMI|nr:uncharacterized protein LOC119728802 isoform X2 [Patiria miniata]